MKKQAILPVAAYWVILMVSAYLGSGFTFYLVTIPAIAFGVWQVSSYLRERASQQELERSTELELETRSQTLKLNPPTPHSMQCIARTNSYTDRQECQVCGYQTDVYYELYGGPYDSILDGCKGHPNYQPTSEERECALDVHLCDTRYNALMREVETGQPGKPCQCWIAVFKG